MHPFNMKESMDMIETFLDQYKNTWQPDRRLLFEEYKVTDVALKVVGGKCRSALLCGAAVE